MLATDAPAVGLDGRLTPTTPACSTVPSLSRMMCPVRFHVRLTARPAWPMSGTWPRCPGRLRGGLRWVGHVHGLISPQVCSPQLRVAASATGNRRGSRLPSAVAKGSEGKPADLPDKVRGRLAHRAEATESRQPRLRLLCCKREPPDACSGPPRASPRRLRRTRASTSSTSPSGRRACPPSWVLT